jgi:hypothetical protein
MISGGKYFPLCFIAFMEQAVPLACPVLGIFHKFINFCQLDFSSHPRYRRDTNMQDPIRYQATNKQTQLIKDQMNTNFLHKYSSSIMKQ